MPLSYAAALKTLRTLLVSWGGCPDPSVYTLRSMKSTFLSWMAQVGVPEELRAKQGHHRQTSAQLYSRDDVFPQLRAQKLWWGAFQKGFRPLTPQHRGGQRPLSEPQVRAMPSEVQGPQRKASCFRSPPWKCLHAAMLKSHLSGGQNPPCGILCKHASHDWWRQLLWCAR